MDEKSSSFITATNSKLIKISHFQDQCNLSSLLTIPIKSSTIAPFLVINNPLSMQSPATLSNTIPTFQNSNVQSIKIGQLANKQQPLLLNLNNIKVLKYNNNASSSFMQLPKNNAALILSSLTRSNPSNITLPTSTKTSAINSYVPILPNYAASQNSQNRHTSHLLLKLNLSSATSSSSRSNYNIQGIQSSSNLANDLKSLFTISRENKSFKPLLVPASNLNLNTNLHIIGNLNQSHNTHSNYSTSSPLILSPISANTLGICDNSSFKGGRKRCNCSKSQCLKLYCECFANGEFCYNCNCNNCYNNIQNEEERKKAIKAILERNPLAFHPKIGKTNVGEVDRKHAKGCNCRRSGCLKNYCECFEAKITCSSLCKCVSCKNYEDSYERRTSMLLPPFLLQQPQSHQQLNSHPYPSFMANPLTADRSYFKGHYMHNRSINPDHFDIDLKRSVMSNSINTYHVMINSKESRDKGFEAVKGPKIERDSSDSFYNSGSFRDRDEIKAIQQTSNFESCDMSRKLLDEIAYGDPSIKLEQQEEVEPGMTRQVFNKLNLPKSCLYPSNFLTNEIIEAIVTCMLAKVYDDCFLIAAPLNNSTLSSDASTTPPPTTIPTSRRLAVQRGITREFGQCLLRIINVLKSHALPQIAVTDVCLERSEPTKDFDSFKKSKVTPPPEMSLGFLEASKLSGTSVLNVAKNTEKGPIIIDPLVSEDEDDMDFIVGRSKNLRNKICSTGKSETACEKTSVIKQDPSISQDQLESSFEDKKILDKISSIGTECRAEIMSELSDNRRERRAKARKKLDSNYLYYDDGLPFSPDNGDIHEEISAKRLTTTSGSSFKKKFPNLLFTNLRDN